MCLGRHQVKELKIETSVFWQNNHAYQTFFIFLAKRLIQYNAVLARIQRESAEKAFVHSKQELTHHASEQQVYSESACILAVSPATLTKLSSMLRCQQQCSLGGYISSS